MVGGARVELLADAGTFAAEADRELAAAGKTAAAAFDKSFAPAITTSMAETGAASGEVFWKGADGRLRDAQGKFVSRGRAAAAGYTDGVIEGMEIGRPKVAEAGASQGRAASKGFAAQGAKAGEGFMAKLQTALLGKHMITGAIFAGIGYEAVKMAGDFQTGMTRLVTAAGESQANLARVSQGTLQISRDTGVGAHELAAGMYMVESAGFHGQKALQVMSAAAEGAKVDMADANVVANALTTVLTDMGSKAGPPAEVMSKLVATVGHGKMTMDEFAASIHSVLPNAVAIGLSLEQTAGAVATMTAQGITAQQATQNLNHAILSLVNPTAVQTKAMAAFGLNATDVAKNLGTRGLTGTLDLLQHTILQHMGPAGLTMEKTLNSSAVAADKANRMFATLSPEGQRIAKMFMDGDISAGQLSKSMSQLNGQQGILGKQWATSYTRAHGFNDLLKSGSPDALTYSGALAKMTGGQVGLQVALHLTGENMATYKANVHAISEAHTEAGGHVEGWAIKQKTFNQVISQLGATLKANLITLGMALIPVLTRIGQVLLDYVFPAMAAVSRAVRAVFSAIAHNDALKVFVGVILGAVFAMKLWEGAVLAVRGALVSARVAMWLLNTAILSNPVAWLVVGIAALAAGLVYAYQHFKPFREIVDAVGRALRTAFLFALHAVEAAFHDVAKVVLAAPGWFVRMWHESSKAVSDLWHDITGFFSHMRDDVTGFVSRIYDDVTGFFARLYNSVANAVSDTTSAVTGAWDDTRSYIGGIFSRMGEDLHKHWRLILFITTGGLGLIWIVVQDHWKAISGFFLRIYHDVAGFVGRLWADVTGFFSRINRDVSGFSLATHHRVVGLWTAVWTAVSGFALRIWRDVSGFFLRIWRDVSGFALRIYRDVAGFFSAMNNAVDRITAAVHRRAVAVWAAIWTAVSGFAARIWHDVSGFFTRIATDVGGVLDRFWHRLRLGWDALYTVTSTIVGKIWHGVTDFFGRMRDEVVKIFDGMVTGIGRAWDKVKDIVAKPVQWIVQYVYDDGIVKIWNALAGVLHEPGMKLEPVHFARGGVVPGNRADGDWVPIYATAGEGVLNLQGMEKIGGAAGLAALNGANGAAQSGHFGVGGVISSAAGAAVGAVNPFVPLLGHSKLARGALASGVGPAIHALESRADSYLNPLGGLAQMLNHGVHQIGDKILAWVAADDKRATTAGAGDAVMRWKPIVDLVLDMLGRSRAEDGAVLARIGFESGGDPHAINLTDQNAMAGYPSKGLTQTIDSTFAAYAGPYASRGIFDPLANIYAGENYAIHRYGGMPDPRITHQGYDSGGVLAPGLTLAENNTGRDEYVLTGDVGDQIVDLLAIIAGKNLNIDGRKATTVIDNHRAYKEARLR